LIHRKISSRKRIFFFEYGFLLLNDYFGRNQEIETIDCLKKSWGSQDIKGLFWFGVCLFKGRSVKKDII
jgi:hypothetical protein